MTYVYVRSEPALWTVGFYGPDSKWEPESDHGSPDEAAARVAYLNGGGPDQSDREIERLRGKLERLATAAADAAADFEKVGANTPARIMRLVAANANPDD